MTKRTKQLLTFLSACLFAGCGCLHAFAADTTMSATLSCTGRSGPDGAFIGTDTQTLALSVSGGDGSMVDVYVALGLADGSLLCLNGVNQFSPTLTPLASLPLTSVENATVFTRPLSGIPEGTYMWCFVIVPAGKEVASVSNWLASDFKSWIFQEQQASSSNVQAVVTTVAADFSSGAVSSITSTQCTANNLLAFTSSDNMVKIYGNYAYLLGRFGTNAVTKVPLNNIASSGIVYQYSTKDAQDTGDPNLYDMVFVSETKAYLLRNSSARIWVVNPSATSEAEWKTGEIDLSSFVASADSDGSPEPVQGVIADGKLYVVCQNLDTSNMYAPVAPSTVVVIDTATDTVVDTDGDNGNGTTAITCNFSNAHGIEYIGGSLWVSQTGDAYGSSGAHSGLERISPDTYAVKIVFDAGSAQDATYGGAVNDVAMISASQGFCNIYVGWGDVRIRSFSVDKDGTGTVGEPVSALTGITDNFGIERGPDGKLWILSTVGDGGVVVYDPATETASDTINVGLRPYGIAFVE